MGQHEYRLKSLADDELLAGLSSIVGQRNQITAEFLAYLAELDERQLFLDLGFASLFEYCVEKLGLCESSSGRHIAAARVCRNYPEVFALVASLLPPLNLSLNLPNLLDRKFGDELSVNARGGKICVRERFVWAGSNDHESSRVEADFEPEPSAIGALRALKCA